MPHTSSGPSLDASGVLASRLLEFLSNKRPKAQEKLGSRRLDEARELAQKYQASISPSDLKIAKDKFIQCVLSSQSASESCSMPVSASEIREGLESKTGITRFLQAREYKKAAKEALRFVKVTHTYRIGDPFSHDLVICRPSLTELRMTCSGRGRWA
jgi:hypothetical protein